MVLEWSGVFENLVDSAWSAEIWRSLKNVEICVWAVAVDTIQRRAWVRSWSWGPFVSINLTSDIRRVIFHVFEAHFISGRLYMYILQNITSIAWHENFAFLSANYVRFLLKHFEESPWFSVEIWNWLCQTTQMQWSCCFHFFWFLFRKIDWHLDDSRKCECSYFSGDWLWLDIHARCYSYTYRNPHTSLLDFMSVRITCKLRQVCASSQSDCTTLVIVLLRLFNV